MSDRAEAMKACYEVANKTEKGCLLDEFTAITCHHRKSVIRVLSESSYSSVPARTSYRSPRLPLSPYAWPRPLQSVVPSKPNQAGIAISGPPSEKFANRYALAHL